MLVARLWSALLVLPLASAAVTCTSSYGSSFVEWCDTNCNHVPAFCPASICTCSGGSPTPTPVASTGTLYCTSVYSTTLLNDWCNLNCNHVPPFCPSSLCSCSTDALPQASASSGLSAYDDSVFSACCADADAQAYFINQGDVYYINLDANGDAEGSPVLCSDFVNAVDIEIDSNGGLFVADHNAAAVFYVAPGCGTKHEVASWAANNIPAPSYVTIFEDAILVGVNPGNMYRVNLDSNLRYTSHSLVLATDNWVSMDTWGRWVFSIAGDKIMKYNMDTQESLVYFNGNSQTNRLPDLADLVVQDTCGLFFSVPDSNQVWHCTDLTDGSTCSMYCTKSGIDSDTCTDIWNPWGVALDCQCNLYVTNKAGGLLVRYNYGSSPLTNVVVRAGLSQPQDVEVYVPKTGCLPSTTPSASVSASSSRSPSASSSPSRSATPSVSATPSRSATPSASTSASPSSSSTPSTSSSASPSPSASQSASPSVSESPPPPSASPSASPSAQWNFAMSIEDMNAVCVQGTCSDTDATIRSDIAAVAGSARILGIYTQINYVVTDPLDPNCETVNIQTTPTIAIICTRTPTPAQVSNSAAALSDIILYIRVQTGNETFPAYSMNWQHLGPLTFPNAYLKRSGTMAIVDCTGHNNLEFIVAWGLTRLCWNDPVFGRELCHEGFTNTGTIDGGGTYLDTSGNALDGFWPHKKFVCVESTP